MSINRHVMELSLGFALATLVYTATASPAFADHKPNHNPGGGDGDDGSTHMYSLFVSGTLSPGEGTDSLGIGPVPGGGSKPVHATAALDLDLSFFFDKFDSGRGENCFGADALVQVPVPATARRLSIREERGGEKTGSALVSYGFTGYADNGGPEVNYVLEMYGGFSDKPWRPVDGHTLVTLDSWKMGMGNGPGAKSACLGGSDPDGDGFETFIDVWEPPEPPML